MSRSRVAQVEHEDTGVEESHFNDSGLTLFRDARHCPRVTTETKNVRLDLYGLSKFHRSRRSSQAPSEDFHRYEGIE